MFVDEIKLSVHSGAGGSGSVSFKKTSSKSSPSGGSGGSGGSVLITVNEELNDLSHIISNSSLKAENGTDGNKNFQNGKKEVFNQLSEGIRNIILRSKELDGLDQSDNGDENNGSNTVGQEPVPF